jgi:GNAT superfamily N-acetyltransferase
VSGVVCRLVEADGIGIVRPLLSESSFSPLRHLKEIPEERLCDFWQGELDAASQAAGGFAFSAEADGRLAGFCTMGDLPWESAILGRKIASVRHLVAAPEERNAEVLDALLDAALRRARAQGCDFILCKTYTDELGAVHALQRQGFLLVDTVLDFEVDLRRFPPSAQKAPPLPPDALLRVAEESDRHGLVETARRAFAGHFGRFHSDPRLGPEAGLKIYERWIESCLDGWADWVVLAEVGGRIAGYSAWKRPSAREASHGIGLGHYSIGAVHPDYSGRGLFSALTLKGSSLLEGLADRIEGPTHVNNYGVQRGYLKLGWRVENAHHSFHKWLKD